MPAQTEKQEDVITLLNQLDETGGEKVPIIVQEEEPPVEKDVQSYIEQLEKGIQSFQTVTDNAGQPLVSPPAPQNPVITLPISQSTYTLGLTKKVSDSLRWLAEWCFRLLRVFGDRASFKEGEIQ